MPEPERVEISADAVGRIRVAPTSFLEMWGVYFVACGGGWILVVASSLLIYFLKHQPPVPALPAGAQSADQMKEAVNNFRLLADQWRDSLSYIFDLLVTKTVLPVVTLLLGYLFGKARSTGIQ